jgi:leader peptidase (prepilin peptidase) / N-methyltransferase
MPAALIPASSSPCALGVLLALGGAAVGRGLGLLLDRLAAAGGLPGGYGGPAGGGWRSRLPLAGHWLAPRGTRSARAAALEAAVAAAFVACGLALPPAPAACGALLLAALAAASAFDADHLLIPDLFTIGLALAGLALSGLVPALHGIAGAGPWAGARSVAAGIVGLAAGSACGFWIAALGEWLLGREVLGLGDVKLLGAVGAFCGWQGALASLFGGAILGGLVLAAAEAHRRLRGRGAARLLRLEAPDGEVGRVGWGVQFPFGPMLAAAAALYFLALHGPVDRLLAPYALLF